MKCIMLSLGLVIVCITLQLNQCWADQGAGFVSEKSNPPKALKGFWSGIKDEWLPQSQSDFWTETQRANVHKYCQQYAKSNSPEKVLPELIKDLKSRESEVRTFIYAWIVTSWDPVKVKTLLEPYYLSKDPNEKRAAADLIAEVEQLSSSATL